jgi:glutathione S-transferase
MLRFYDANISGNAWKVRLLLAQLAIPHEAVRFDLLKGEARTPGFRKQNPFGRVPYIVEDDFGLAESNAILLYLARGSRLLPDDARTQALIQQWMFFEQNQVELNIGVPRVLALLDQREEQARLDSYFRPRATAALKVLERHLAQKQWLVGERYSVADIALCAYVQTAPEVGHDFAQYPAVSAWLARIRGQPGFVKLE